MFTFSSWKWSRGAATKTANLKTYRALRYLDDRAFKDIGLCRSDVFTFKSGNDPRDNLWHTDKLEPKTLGKTNA